MCYFNENTFFKVEETTKILLAYCCKIHLHVHIDTLFEVLFHCLQSCSFWYLGGSQNGRETLYNSL